MKKYLTGLVCALLLTGCQMGNRNNTNTPTNDNNTQNDLRDGANDINDGINDMTDDIQDGINDMTDDNHDSQNKATGYTDTTTKQLGLGPYSKDQPNTTLWEVPSFCNSLVGRYYPQSLI